MPALDQNAVKVSGSPRNPVTITNNGSADIYTHKSANVSISNHVGVIKPTGSTVVTDDIWIATDGSAGSYTTTTASTALGSELGYAEMTSPWGPTAFTVNQIIAVPGLSVVVAVAAKPVIVEAFLPAMLHTVACDLSTQLYEDGGVVQASTQTLDTASKSVIGWAKCRRIAAPGNHTYEVRTKATSAGNMTVQGNALFPAYLRVAEA